MNVIGYVCPQCLSISCDAIGDLDFSNGRKMTNIANEILKLKYNIVLPDFRYKWRTLYVAISVVILLLLCVPYFYN